MDGDDELVKDVRGKEVVDFICVGTAPQNRLQSLDDFVCFHIAGRINGFINPVIVPLEGTFGPMFRNNDVTETVNFVIHQFKIIYDVTPTIEAAMTLKRLFEDAKIAMYPYDDL